MVAVVIAVAAGGGDIRGGCGGGWGVVGRTKMVLWLLLEWGVCMHNEKARW
jgi:hypothetical protein